MNDSYRILKKMKEKHSSKFALATIIAVDGSTYRHPGAKMLIDENGSHYGTISAGCLEEDLSHHAQEVILKCQPKTLVYDLKSQDDLSWGQGAGCNGSIKIYVEPCEWGCIPQSHDQRVWPLVEAALQLGNKVASAKSLSDNNSQRVQLFYMEDGTVFGNAESDIRNKIIPELQKFLHSEKKTEVIQLADIESDFLLELYEPREELYIFGAGPDVEPITQRAAELDFCITIIDPRSSYCNAQRFPAADRLIIEHPDSFLQTYKIPHKSYVLVMTHSFERDQTVLRNLVPSSLKYLGVLGPRRRTERLLSPDPLPECIHSPIGLDIGAEGPEEIAIAIMAQLLKIRNRK
jgi:xanthine dehydrogenase accessory factor